MKPKSSKKCYTFLKSISLLCLFIILKFPFEVIIVVKYNKMIKQSYIYIPEYALKVWKAVRQQF